MQQLTPDPRAYAVIVTFALGVVAGFAPFSPAQALEPRECAAPQEMMASLQEDAGGNVFTLATMNLQGVDVDTNDNDVRTAQVVMSNSNFSKFYVVKGNAPLGERSSELCLSLQGRDLEANDYREDRPPTVTSYTFNTEAAKEQCEQINTNIGANTGCKERSEALEHFKGNSNQHLAFQGIETLENGQDGVLWSLIADPAEEGGFRTLGSLDQGATIVGGSGEGFLITDILDDHLRR